MSDEKKEAIKNWIISNSQKVEAADIDFDTPILANKILSSLKVMEMIVYLESLSGKPVNPANLKPGSFSDINTIYKNFIGE